jgi:N-glycosidase YbiA
MIDEFKGEFRFLSNFWPAIVEFEGIIFPTVEHAYQAAKTLDMQARRVIAEMPLAGDAKRAGRTLDIRPDWEEVKIDVMRQLLEKKFFGHFRLMQDLMATKPHELVEGNWWGDTFWGICKGQGENHLGKLLMGIRDKE